MQQNISKLFHNAEGIVILAGAGMGVDSGLADFRGDTGLWTTAKENFLKYSTARAFDDDPVVAWNFYIDRILQYGNVVPHLGFTNLLNLLKQHNKEYFVVTSNVDGHFQKAGYDPNLIQEIHGDLRHTQCKNVCSRTLYPMPKFECKLETTEDLPKCPNCSSILRPHVMMFSDTCFLWQNVDIGADRYRAWSYNKLNIIGIEIGAGTTIPSIRYFGEERTVALIRVNLYESDVTRPQDIAISATASDGIDQIVGAV